MPRRYRVVSDAASSKFSCTRIVEARCGLLYLDDLKTPHAMKRLVGTVILLVLLTLGAVAGYVLTQRLSAPSAVARVAEIHGANESLEEHLVRYEGAMRLVGAPFRAIDSLGGLLDRVENRLRDEVGRTQVGSSRTVESYTPGGISWALRSTLRARLFVSCI